MRIHLYTYSPKKLVDDRIIDALAHATGTTGMVTGECAHFYRAFGEAIVTVVLCQILALFQLGHVHLGAEFPEQRRVYQRQAQSYRCSGGRNES